MSQGSRAGSGQYTRSVSDLGAPRSANPQSSQLSLVFDDAVPPHNALHRRGSQAESPRQAAASDGVARNMRNIEICCSAAESSPGAPAGNNLAPRGSVCLRHRLSRLLGSEHMADVHFVLRDSEGGEVRRPAHRLLLAVASPVFDAMFNGQMAEPADVVIPDISDISFRGLLRFIYTDEVELAPGSVMGVLYAAKKYAIDSLQERCVDFLRARLAQDNAFTLLGQARLFDEPQLAALCLDVIDRHTNDAMASEGFLDIDRDTLCAVLQRDTLCIRENRVFANVSRWSEHECQRLKLEPTPANKRYVLGPALQLIRFPLMTAEEFANDAAQTGLLEAEDSVSLFLWYLATPKPGMALFSSDPRCCTAGREITASRFQHVELRWGYSGTADKIKFSVSRHIYVVGLGLYGSVASAGHYSALIQLTHCETRELRASCEQEYDTDGSKRPVVVRFAEPVSVDANTAFLASATIRGPDTYYGTRGQRCLDVALPGDTSATFSFSYACSSNNGTSVEDGQIPDIVFFA